ncbi:MAG: methylmalonyl-CoA epimerase [Planctomycetota bacterium]
MIRKVDHIGVAVSDLEAAISVYRDVLGMELGGREEVPLDRVRVAMMRGGDDVIELLEPTEPDSHVARFLERRGPGIHHICLKVDDVAEVLERCRAAGLRLIDEAPRPGAGGCRVAFLHPKSTSGVLIELSEGGHGHE